MLKKIIRFCVIVVLGFALGFVLAAVAGRFLPERVTSEKSVAFEAPLADVWEVLVNVEDYPKWKPGVKRVEALGRTENDMLQWREYYRDHSPMTFEVVRVVNQQFLEIKISDQSRTSVQSRWVFRLSDYKGSGILHIKQYAMIPNTYRRFESKFIVGPLVEVDAFIFAVGKRLKAMVAEKQQESSDAEGLDNTTNASVD